MNLLEKLNNINKPNIKPLPKGEVFSVEQIWDELIKGYLPKKEIVLAWHEILFEYIHTGYPTFAIRGYNTFPKEKYGDLRRGFLTRTEEFSFFYTDNFFAAYFQKMAMDGFVPTLTELVDVFKQRKFPSRFGRNTKEERELLAIKQGKDPQISSAGFKIAHIIPVGKEYGYNELSAKDILKTYFPKGERSDWKLKNDVFGDFYERDLSTDKLSRKYAVAHFLRFVHPFNYFLCPKKDNENNNKCKELAEYQPLLNYARDFMCDLYGEAYYQFLELILSPQKYYDRCYNVLDSSINVKYGVNLENPTKSITKKDKLIAEIERLKRKLAELKEKQKEES